MFYQTPWNYNYKKRPYRVWRRKPVDGLNGSDGEDGAIGPIGPQGLSGPVGNTGPKGDKGDKGDTGATGATGAPGVGIDTRKIRAQTSASGTYTWTYATPFAAGVVPTITIAVEAGTDTLVGHLVGTPTNTSCQIRVTRPVGALVTVLGLSVLGAPGAVGQVWVHLTATA